MPTYPEPISIPLQRTDTMRKLLEFVNQDEYSKEGAILDLSGERDFIVYASCRRCNERINLYKPSFRIYDTDVICSNCKNGSEPINIDIPVDKKAVYIFDLRKQKVKYLI